MFESRVKWSIIGCCAGIHSNNRDSSFGGWMAADEFVRSFSGTPLSLDWGAAGPSSLLNGSRCRAA